VKMNIFTTFFCRDIKIKLVLTTQNIKPIG
jgi:hypothetical protein